ncbi:hypothetical protein [Agarilytica rhodophyticola]|nr:hypothetical protein [Agarilytica rhodophyticola]
MKVAVKQFKSEEGYVFLLGEDAIPDFWVTHFVPQSPVIINLAVTHMVKV